MPLQETSGNVTTDAYGGGTAVTPVYIEDVMSTFLYTGNAPTGQSINNGIDLSTKGGLLWCKNRTTGSTPHYLFDTARGFSYSSAESLNTASSAAAQSNGTNYAKPEVNGFSFGTGAGSTSPNKSGDNFASWTFRKQPKFFDVVTYTGDGTAGRQIPHNLGSVPGCIIVKRTSNAANWVVYHRSTGNTNYLILNAPFPATNDVDYWYSTTPTSTNFTVNSYSDVNGSGSTYVAYIYAYDAGGFGLTGTDNVISCGSFSLNSAVGVDINLGYEAQWVLIKRSDSSSGSNGWYFLDTMRGWTVDEIFGDKYLLANTTAAEAGQTIGRPTATGFAIQASTWLSTGDYIYIAIRRGPMKVPTDATKVFAPLALNNSTGTINTTNFPVDLQMFQGRTGDYTYVFDRLRGISSNSTASGVDLLTQTTGAESTDPGTLQWDNTSFKTSSYTGGISTAFWNFRRAPSFFDEVCYTGTGTATTFTHNLGVAPELMIVKNRGDAQQWLVYQSTLGASSYLRLNSDGAASSGTAQWNGTSPTASVFSVGTSAGTNEAGYAHVAYLFATCAGVSKVGSYTGNGSTQTINCGFTGGARFVLIKRTDSTGDWYVYDTARGMTTLTDPYLLLNSTAAESATLGSVTTVSTGFAVNASILAAINTNAASYIFLAIA